MINGDIIKGKTTILDYVSSVLNYSQVENKLNCFGSEYSMFLQVFCHIWKVKLDLKCDSPYSQQNLPNDTKQPIHCNHFQ